jgi:pantoate--beta-alanine ligase
MKRASLLAVRRPAASTPAVFRHRTVLEAWRRRAEGPVGFVPTMGALHEGHAALVRRARAECESVVASVFVNPLQFGQASDLARYPRTLDADVALLAREGCDAVYAPDADDVYPEGMSSFAEVGGLSTVLEGAARPGHFRGVATVVAKLLLRARPDRSFFGRKDAQQCAVVRRLVRDLDLPGEVVAAPTVRDVDGLALSSRNRFLSPEDRERALAIPASLFEARLAAASGERRASALAEVARGVLSRASIAPDYLVLVDPDSFAEADALEGRPALLVVAAKVGSVRLLDNAWVAAPA